MAITFPTTIDNLPSVSATTPTLANHSSLHNTSSEVIEALEAKVGIDDSTVTTSLDYRVNTLEDGSSVTKATGTELDTATDDAKFATAKALKDSHNVPSVAPSTDGNVLTSDGTDWVSETPAGSSSPLASNFEASDHGTAATDMIINVCYGTSTPPTASTTTIGTLFIKYTA